MDPIQCNYETPSDDQGGEESSVDVVAIIIILAFGGICLVGFIFILLVAIANSWLIMSVNFNSFSFI